MLFWPLHWYPEVRSDGVHVVVVSVVHVFDFRVDVFQLTQQDGDFAVQQLDKRSSLVFDVIYGYKVSSLDLVSNGRRGCSCVNGCHLFDVLNLGGHEVLLMNYTL